MATKFFAVGALCLHAEGKVGLIATQALVNPLYGIDGLGLLRSGLTAEQVIAKVTISDPGRAHRQVHVMPAKGEAAAFTGGECIAWCGHLQDDDISLAGNMLAGPDVLTATAEAYRRARDLPLAQRLIAALKRGQDAGGDKRGRQSAALKIVSSEPYPDLDIRVDDHADPLDELSRLEAVSRERFVHFRECLPKRANYGGVFDRAKIESLIAERQGR